MEIPTTRIELDCGGWVELYSELRRVTVRMHESLLRKYMKPVTDGKPLLLSELRSGEKTLPTDYEIDATAIDHGEVNELYMLYQVKSWAFGEVRQATIDNLTKAQFNAICKEMDKLYEFERPLLKSDA